MSLSAYILIMGSVFDFLRWTHSFPKLILTPSMVIIPVMITIDDLPEDFINIQSGCEFDLVLGNK